MCVREIHMKISRVIIENYRNLKNVDVTLGNTVTLIGENNCGKSNFLRALSIPLLSDDSGNSKHLSWHDINREAKEAYYTFLSENKERILNESLSVEQFIPSLPEVIIKLYFQPNENEHYNIREILCEGEAEQWVGGICYRYYQKNTIKIWLSAKTQYLSAFSRKQTHQFTTYLLLTNEPWYASFLRYAKIWYSTSVLKQEKFNIS